MAHQRNWLLCYDIRCPKRLARVHRICSRYGLAVQYSVFYLEVSSTELQMLEAELAQVIDNKCDDIRIYPVAGLDRALLFGTSCLPPMMEAAIKARAGTLFNNMD